MFIVSLFKMAQKWKEPSTNVHQQRNRSTERWYVHPVEYYSAIKWKFTCNRIHITTWLNLENIRLSERSWSQKTTCHMIPFIHTSRSGKSRVTESRFVLPRVGGSGRGVVGRGEGMGNKTTNRFGISFGGGGGNALKLDCHGGCPTLGVH